MNKPKPKTYVAIVLDKSGSMEKTKEATISGFNEQVQQLKEDSKTQDILCSLVTFNGGVFEHLWNVPAQQLAEAKSEDFNPDGSTAMRDAVGYTVQKLIATTEHEDPNVSYLIIVISDGDTNADKIFTKDLPHLRDLLSSCQETKRWTFNYIGCGEQYLRAISAETATPIGNMAAWSNASPEAVGKSLKKATERQKKYFEARGAGFVGTANYASDGIAMADYAADDAPPWNTESFGNVKFGEAPAFGPINFGPVGDSYPKLANPYVAKPGFTAAEAVNVNLEEIRNRSPKYVAQNAPTYNGEALFSNSVKVKWEVVS